MRTHHAASPCVSRQPAPAAAARGRRPSQGIWRVVACYLLLGTLWIIGGNWILMQLVNQPHPAAGWQLAGNAMFLVATATLLYLLLRSQLQGARQVRLQLARSEASGRGLFGANPSPMLIYDLNDLTVIDANLAAAGVPWLAARSTHWHAHPAALAAVDAVAPAPGRGVHWRWCRSGAGDGRADAMS